MEQLAPVIELAGGGGSGWGWGCSDLNLTRLTVQLKDFIGILIFVYWGPDIRYGISWACCLHPEASLPSGLVWKQKFFVYHVPHLEPN